MKQGDDGYAPSYNAQISTDAANGIIVGAGVSQSASDYQELVRAVERIEENIGRQPERVVVDGGFTSRGNIMEMAAKNVDMIGSPDERNAQSVGQMKRRGVDEAFYPKAIAYDAQGRCGVDLGMPGVQHHAMEAAVLEEGIGRSHELTTERNRAEMGT